MSYYKIFYNIGKFQILLTLILLTFANGSEIWKISLDTGENLSCTKLYQLANDSLYTEILGENINFAVKDISNITSFKKNVNIGLISGSIAGGLIGYLIGEKNNDVTAPMIGSIGGTLIAHIINYNKSINLSKMSLKEKYDILEKLVFYSN